RHHAAQRGERRAARIGGIRAPVRLSRRGLQDGTMARRGLVAPAPRGAAREPGAAAPLRGARSGVTAFQAGLGYSTIFAALRSNLSRFTSRRSCRLEMSG